MPHHWPVRNDRAGFRSWEVHLDEVIGGVDTHTETHCAALVDACGRLLGVNEFAASESGYRKLTAWMRSHGSVRRVGVEGTGAYGAGLARHLRSEGVEVLEVSRPDRRTRRRWGKSDPIDAEAAARAVLAGTATIVPKGQDGVIEAVRALRVARKGQDRGDEHATFDDRHGTRGAAQDP